MYRFGSGIFLVNPFVYAGGGPAPSYLVDDYSPAAAYSLRKLSSTATNAIRVRRSSDNAETDIGFSGDDLDTASLLSFVGANDGFVVKWYNQGDDGSNYDCIQGTALSQAKIVSSGSIVNKNGKEAVIFNGGNIYQSITRTDTPIDYMQYPTAFVAVGSVESQVSSPYVEGIMGSNRSTGGNLRGHIYYFDASANNRLHTIVTGTVNEIFNLSSQINSNNQRMVSSFIDSSNNGEAFYNGVSQESISSVTAISSGSISYITIGGQLVGNRRLNGYIQEFIIWRTDESANRTSIESNINDYYGIY